MVTVCSKSRVLRWVNNVCKLHEQLGIWDITICWSLVVHASMTSSCRSLMSYIITQVYCQQVKEALSDPNSKIPVLYRLECGAHILEASWEEDSPRAPLESTFPSAPATKLSVDVHQALPDIGSCIDTGDLQTKLIKTGMSWHQLECFCSIKGSRLPTSPSWV